MAQAKRSPILGYNHNVRYRGVVFHVQTEDSGMQNPHLFTHLFHEGVIVSTRKLVYDAGSNEDAIKALMQAQHKAVMKDLKKGTFDDKIDAYLGDVPGLEPREGGSAGGPKEARAKTEHSPPPAEAVVEEAAPALEIVQGDELSEPIELPIKGSRVSTGDRTRPISIDPHGATLSEAEMKAAIEAANAGAPAADPEPAPAKARTSTAQKVSRSSVGATPPSGTPRPQPGASARPQARASSPVVDITDEELSARTRVPRDTAVEAVPDEMDGIPQHTTPNRPERPAAHGAAALPKAPSRPGMSPPIVTRPATGERNRPDDSEAVEIYQPAPPSVDAPPGERSERAGTYSVTRKNSDAPIREKTGRIAAINPSALGLENQAKPAAVPAGLGRPGVPPANRPTMPGGSRDSRDSGSQRVPQGVQREPTPSTPQRPTPPGTPRPGTGPVPARTGTPQSAPHHVRSNVTAPIANRTSTPVAGSGVVMTRPAVIVGAPPKPAAQPTTQRVRKAREDEGRGFGQGLISEKSLDEVILAYLSEDAEEK